MNKYLTDLKEKLFGRRQTPADDLKLQTFIGDRLETIVANGSFDVLVEFVLDEMEKEAFQLFKKQDPKDFNSVCQTQKLAQVVDEVKKRVERKIEQGRFARQRLAEMAQEDEI